MDTVFNEEYKVHDEYAFELTSADSPKKVPKQADAPIQTSMFSGTLPQIGTNVMEIPDIFGLSSLFAISMKRYRPDVTIYLENEKLHVMKGRGMIILSGPMLTPDHEEVLLALYRALQKKQLLISEPLYITTYELLREAGLGTGKKDYVKLQKILNELDTAKMQISSESIFQYLIEAYTNVDKFPPEIRDSIQNAMPLVRDMKKEGFVEGNRFITVKFIRNIIGKMSTGDKFGIIIDPYTFLLFYDNTIKLPRDERRQYKEKLTYKIMNVVYWQSNKILPWTEGYWHSLFLPKEEAEGMFLRDNRNHRVTFKKHFIASLKECERWGAILPCWKIANIKKPQESGKGAPIKTFKTVGIHRINKNLLNSIRKLKYSNGTPTHSFFAHLQFLWMSTPVYQSEETAYISFSKIKEIFINAPVMDDLQPNDERDLGWDEYLAYIVNRYIDEELIGKDSEIVTMIQDGVGHSHLKINLSKINGIKALKGELLKDDSLL